MKSQFSNFFMFLFFVLSIFLFSGCGDDTEILPDGPSMEVEPLPTADDTNLITVEAGETVEFGVGVTAPGTFNVLRMNVSIDGVMDNTLSEEIIRTTDGQTTLSETFSITTGAAWVGSDIEVEFEAVDDNNKTIVDVYDIEVTSPTARIYTEVLLNSPTGSKTSETFYSTSDGQRYTVNEVNTGAAGLSGSIDFGYYYGANALASLASPSDYPALIYDLSAEGWNSLNTSNFKSASITDETYNAVSTYADLDDIYANATEVGATVTGLEAGDYIAFETDTDKAGGSKKGLIKVLEIVDGNSDGKFDGSVDGIKIEIIVQEPAS